MQDLKLERTVEVGAEALPSPRGPLSARMLDLLTGRLEDAIATKFS